VVLVYSDKKTKIDGKHIKPSDFSGKPFLGASEVFTDDANIREVYEKVGIKTNQLKEVKNGNGKSQSSRRND
jgi:Golgi nucleoside diphosphatase